METARAYLEGLSEKSRTATLKVSCQVAKGKPAKEILREAKEAGADMVAMATHRDRLIERGILGSVTDTVLRTSPVPVLAVRPDGATGKVGSGGVPKTVIVPLDGSPLAEKSVPVGLEIAHACSAEVIFMRTVPIPSFAVSGPGTEYYDVMYGVTPQRREALEYLAQFVRQAEGQGLKARSHAGIGSAAARILEDIQGVEDAMVVITSHGRGGIRRMVLGSVADKIVRASHHPVLVMTQHKG
jgi:nucleotide-binding universal stress UspA family protein